MNRRDLLKGAALVPLAVGLPDAPNESEPPKLVGFTVRIDSASADTGALDSKVGQQFAKDAVREMAGVMGMAKVFTTVQEPEWLTEAVEKAIDEAKQRRRAQLIDHHQRAIERLKSEL